MARPRRGPGRIPDGFPVEMGSSAGTLRDATGPYDQALCFVEATRHYQNRLRALQVLLDRRVS